MIKNDEIINYLINKVQSLEKEIEKIKKPKYLYNSDTGELKRIDFDKKEIIKEFLEEQRERVKFEEFGNEQTKTYFIQLINFMLYNLE